MRETIRSVRPSISIKLGWLSGESASPVTSAPSSRSQLQSQPPLKPVCPVTRTRRLRYASSRLTPEALSYVATLIARISVACRTSRLDRRWSLRQHCRFPIDAVETSSAANLRHIDPPPLTPSGLIAVELRQGGLVACWPASRVERSPPLAQGCCSFLISLL